MEQASQAAPQGQQPAAKPKKKNWLHHLGDFFTKAGDALGNAIGEAKFGED